MNAVVLLIDSSGSVPDDWRHEMEKCAARVAVEADFVGVVCFSDEMQVVLPFGRGGRVPDFNHVRIGGTRYEPALRKAEAMLLMRPAESEPHIIVMTDGDNREDNLPFDPEIPVSVIAFDTRFPEYPAEIARDGGGKFVYLRHPRELMPLLDIFCDSNLFAAYDVHDA